MLIVCMAVSLIGWLVGSLLCCSRGPSSDGGDPPGPFRGQGGQGRGTMMQLRQPSAGTAYTLTYHILSSIPACIHTYMWLFLMCRKWRRRYTPIYFSHPCIQVHMSFMHTYMQHTVVYVCMYACVYYDIKAVSAWGMQGHQTERIFYKRSWWWCNTWIYGVCGSSFSLGLVVCVYVCMYVFIWSLLITISIPSLCLG
jgi:hypothetical protein